LLLRRASSQKIGCWAHQSQSSIGGKGLSTSISSRALVYLESWYLAQWKQSIAHFLGILAIYLGVPPILLLKIGSGKCKVHHFYTILNEFRDCFHPGSQEVSSNIVKIETGVEDIRNHLLKSTINDLFLSFCGPCNLAHESWHTWSLQIELNTPLSCLSPLHRDSLSRQAHRGSTDQILLWIHKPCWRLRVFWLGQRSLRKLYNFQHGDSESSFTEFHQSLPAK
jgi:hypothetical protein